MSVEMGMALPATSLIIPSRNRPGLLLDTVESILRGDAVPAQLVIIDQSDAPHPTLATLTTGRGCEVSYRWTKGAGVSRARNAGAAAARHDLLAFTDDDVLVTSSWFGALIGALLDAGPRGVVTGQVLPADAEGPGSFAPSTTTDAAPAVYAGHIDKDVLFSGNMALYRSAIDEVGGFDPRLGPGSPFGAAEDNDLGFRLLEAGYRIVYAPDAALYHRAWRDDEDYFPLRWGYGRGQGAFFAKHLSLKDRRMLGRLWRSAVDHTVQGAFQMRRRPRQACGNAIYVLGLLSGVAQWTLTQRRMR